MLLYVISQDHVLSEDRDLCGNFVYQYFLKLSSYTQVVPISACTGPHALYETQTERFADGVNVAEWMQLSTK